MNKFHYTHKKSFHNINKTFSINIMKGFIKLPLMTNFINLKNKLAQFMTEEQNQFLCPMFIIATCKEM